MTKKQRPVVLERTYLVRRLPHRVLMRSVQMFAGEWILSNMSWVRQPDGLYRVYLRWRSDVSRFATIACVGDETHNQVLPLYGKMAWLDRLRLWLLTVESKVRRLLRMDK